MKKYKSTLSKKTKILLFVIGLIIGFILGQTFFADARDYTNYSEELLEQLVDNGKEMISKLDQIAENTRNNNCK